MKNPITNPGLTLVIGSTGKTGRRVAARLEDLGVPVRHGSRQADIPFDWAAPATWAPALQDVRAAYVTFVPDLSVPGAPEAITRFTELAREAGVQRLVLLSGRGESEAQRCEEIVAAAGLEWAVVRAAWFMENFSEAFLQGMMLNGTVALPTNGVREPFVSADDIAEVAVAALTGQAAAGRVYEVTGPHLLNFTEAVATVAGAAGLDTQYVEIPHDAFLASLRDQGIPADYVELLDYLFRETLDGRNAALTTGVQEALGREPLDLQDYARGAAAQGAWVRA